MKKRSDKKQDELIIGRKSFAQISKAEGLILSEEAKSDFEHYDKRKLSPEERRQEIMKKFALT